MTMTRTGVLLKLSKRLHSTEPPACHAAHPHEGGAAQVMKGQGGAAQALMPGPAGAALHHPPAGVVLPLGAQGLMQQLTWASRPLCITITHALEHSNACLVSDSMQ